MKTTTIFNLLSPSTGASASSMMRKVISGFLVVTALLLSNAVEAQNGLYTCGYIEGFNYDDDDMDAFVTTAKNGVTPFPAGIQNQKSQYLYSKQELSSTPNEAEAGLITSISFYVTALPTQGSAMPFTLKNYQVSIGHTTLTQLNSTAFGTTDFATTYPGGVVNNIGDMTVTELGWKTIELAIPFQWNGVDNIIVQICKSNTTAELPVNRSTYHVAATLFPSSSKMTRAYHTTSSYGASHTPQGCAYSSTNFANGRAISSSDARLRPDIRFQFACDGTPTGGAAMIAGTSPGATGCAEVTLGVENGSLNSGMEFIWEKADNINMTNAQVVTQGPEFKTLKVTQEAVDMYYRRKAGCGGQFENSTPKKVAAAAVNTYSGGSWSNGTPNATSQRKLLINDNLMVSSDVKACGCEVKPGKSVTVESGVTMQIDSNLKVDGTLTFEDGASLVQKSPDAINTGNIVYKRTSQPLLRYDFTYWSSPVKPQTLVGFSPYTLSDKYYSFNPMTQGWVIENKFNQMVAGKGYIIRAPQSFNISGQATEWTGVFTGIPNNGDVTVDISTGTENFNLIGNPYPSAVDAAAFYTKNADKLDGTFYFWTHHTPMTDANYAATDYAVWNQMGSVAGSPSGSQMTSNGYIAAGQSFMVKGKAGSAVAADEVMFTNDMRKGAGLNDVFFRATPGTVVADNNANVLEKHRVWLNLSNAQAFKQVLVGYAAGATNGYDSGLDGSAMPGAKMSFYAIQAADQLAIQANALPFSPSDQIALGFSTTVAGNHTVSLPQYDGLFSSQDVLLEDTLLNVLHNLKEGAYTFASATGTFNSRFVLRFGSVASLSKVKVDEAGIADAILVFKQSQDLVINGGSMFIDTVNVYDLSGRLLISKSGYNSSEVIMANPNWSSQVLIVQLTTVDKTIVTKKVVF